MDMQQTGTNAQRVSALADGELFGDEFAAAVDWLGRDEHAKLTWHAYHLVGDVLRAGESMPGVRELAFSKRLGTSLRHESALDRHLDATKLVANCSTLTGVQRSMVGEERVANDARFEWKWLVSAASLAVFAVIGWQTWGGLADSRGSGQLASTPRADVRLALDRQQLASDAGGEALVMIRDPQLDALLAAHRQSGPRSTFQTSTGFLRNATFEGVGR